MNERSPSEFPSDAKRVLRAASDAGYARDERAALVREPGRVFEDTLDPSLAKRLGPKTIANLLAKLEGKGTSSHELVQLGNALYDMQRFFETNRRRVIDANEQKLIGVGVKLVEESMYNGSLSKLYGKNAAELAFLVNRMAKLKSLPDFQQSIVGFDPERFRSFVDSAEAFANDYLSDETHARSLEAARERRASCEAALASDPVADACAKATEKKRNDTARVAEERARIGNETYMRLAMEDIRGRLQTAIGLFESIYGKSDQYDDPDRLQDERLIGDFYRRLSDPRIPARTAKNIVTDTQTYAPDLLTIMRETPDREGTQWNAEYNLKRALSDYLIPNLMRFREKHAKPDKKSIADFRDLGNRKLAERITDDLLSVATDISGETGPLAALQSMLAEERKSKDELARLWKEISVRSAEEKAPFNAWQTAYDEEQRVGRMHAFLPAERARVARSVQAVRNDMRGKQAIDLYAAKTVLVAADMRARAIEARGGRAYLYREPSAQKIIDVHSFLKQEERETEWNGDFQEYKATYAEVHYQTEYLPLAEMAVLMQTE